MNDMQNETLLEREKLDYKVNQIAQPKTAGIQPDKSLNKNSKL